MTTPGISLELRERFAAAAESAAADAPEIRPGDDVALGLQTLFPDFPAWLNEHRQQQEPSNAA